MINVYQYEQFWNFRRVMIRKLILLFILILVSTSCSLTFIKKRLSPRHKVKEGILFQYDAPSARHVNLAGNFPEMNG